MAVIVKVLDPICSMFILNRHYRTFDAVVDWLVTATGEGTDRKGGHRYNGPLLEVLQQIEDDYSVGLASDMSEHETAPDRLNTLIECNGNVEHLIIFDLQHNRQLM